MDARQILDDGVVMLTSTRVQTAGIYHGANSSQSTSCGNHFFSKPVKRRTIILLIQDVSS